MRDKLSLDLARPTAGKRCIKLAHRRGLEAVAQAIHMPGRMRAAVASRIEAASNLPGWTPQPPQHPDIQQQFLLHGAEALIPGDRAPPEHPRDEPTRQAPLPGQLGSIPFSA